MAHPFPNEEDCYQQIREGRITVSLSLWDAIYYNLGDYIAYIHQTASFFIKHNEPIPVEESRKMLARTMAIRGMMDKVFFPSKIQDTDTDLVGLKDEASSMHPLIRSLLTHYVGNDTHVISLCLSYHLHPIGEQPVAVEDAQKILASADSLRGVLDRLKRATDKSFRK